MSLPAMTPRQNQHASGFSRRDNRDPFAPLRNQFQQRHRQQLESLQETLLGLDPVADFLEAEEPGGGRPTQPGHKHQHGHGNADFSLRGALPPTTTTRAQDPAVRASINHGEKVAAKTLIRQHEEADRRAKEQLYRETFLGGRVSRPQTSPAYPSQQGAVDAAQSEVEQSDDDDGAISVAEEHPRGTTEFRRQNSYEAGYHIDRRDRSFKERREQELTARKEKVRVYNFERKHRDREAAITSSSRRLRVRENYAQYQSGLQHQLARQECIESQEFARRHQMVQDRRVATARRKQLLNVHQDLVLRQGVLDKACRVTDNQRFKHNRLQFAKTYVERQREDRALRAQETSSRQAFAQAKVQSQKEEDRQRIAYTLKHRSDEKQQQLDQSKAHRRAKHMVGQFLRLAQDEIAGSNGNVPRPEDVAAYEETMKAFRDLALDVDSARLQLKNGEWHGKDLIIDDLVISTSLEDPGDAATDHGPETEYGDVEREGSKDGQSPLYPAEARVRGMLGLPAAGAAAAAQAFREEDEEEVEEEEDLDVTRNPNDRPDEDGHEEADLNATNLTGFEDRVRRRLLSEVSDVSDANRDRRADGMCATGSSLHSSLARWAAAAAAPPSSPTPGAEGELDCLSLTDNNNNNNNSNNNRYFVLAPSSARSLKDTKKLGSLRPGKRTTSPTR